MKEKFLALIEKIKSIGIVEDLYNAENSEEFLQIWQNFLQNNEKLHSSIEEWKEDYKGEIIFKKGEKIESPIEVVVCIIAINNEGISESEIFEDYGDLTEALKNIDNNVATGMAEFIQKDYLCNITAEIFFPKEES